MEGEVVGMVEARLGGAQAAELGLRDAHDMDLCARRRAKTAPAVVLAGEGPAHGRSRWHERVVAAFRE